jgi:hypothetical protein
MSRLTGDGRQTLVCMLRANSSSICFCANSINSRPSVSRDAAHLFRMAEIELNPSRIQIESENPKWLWPPRLHVVFDMYKAFDSSMYSVLTNV